MTHIRTLAAIAICLDLLGCATNPRYHHDAAPNLLIQAPAKQKTGTFSHVFTAIHVYHVDAKCRFLSYQGMLGVEDGEASLSLPHNQVSYLNIALVRSGLFGSSDIRQNTLIVPHPGYRYRIAAQRVGEGIKISLQAQKSADQGYADIPLTPWTRKDCRRLTGSHDG